MSAPLRSARRKGSARSSRPLESATANSPSMVLLVLLGVLGVLAYSAFLLNPANRGDLLPYLFVVVTEAVIALSALVAMWTILSGGFDPRDFSYNQTRSRLLEAHAQRADRPRAPAVAVADAARQRTGRRRRVHHHLRRGPGDDLAHGVRRDADARRAPHPRARRRKSEEVRRIADELGAHLRHAAGQRGTRRRATSTTRCRCRPRRVLRHPRRRLRADGELPRRDDAVLREDERRVRADAADLRQPPQLHVRGAGYMQTVFYRLIRPGRNRFNAAFCVGTNVVFRRAAIEQIGGMYTESKSEDVWTSLLLHEAGWRSIFLPLTLAVGDAPRPSGREPPAAALGDGRLRDPARAQPALPQAHADARPAAAVLRDRDALPDRHRPALLLFVPPLEIYFDLRPVNISCHAGDLGAVLRRLLRHADRPRVLRGRLVQGRDAAALQRRVPDLRQGAHNVLLGRKTTWKATGARSAVDSPFNYIVPQMLMFLFLALTSVVGVWRDLDNGVLTLATAWNVTNGLVLLVFIGGRHPRVARAPAARPGRAEGEPRGPTAALRPGRSPSPREPSRTGRVEPHDLGQPVPAAARQHHDRRRGRGPHPRCSTSGSTGDQLERVDQGGGVPGRLRLRRHGHRDVREERAGGAEGRAAAHGASAQLVRDVREKAITTKTAPTA